MKPFRIVPAISEFTEFEEFARQEGLNEKDLIITNEYIYEPVNKTLNLPCKTLFQEKYGASEPTDVMIDAILDAVRGEDFERIIAIGGGSVMDISKLVSVASADDKVDDLFAAPEKIKKRHMLYCLPTTCGTGSEVTCLVSVNRTRLGTKVGFGVNDMFADHAVLISSLLQSLPYKVFATSSIDAFVHAAESYLSPNACEMSRMFSENALKLIISGWIKADKEGAGETWKKYAAEFQRGSNYAGIAFGYGGCAAVHALAYPLGGVHHVPHGQSNQMMFEAVMRKYKEKKPVGKINNFEAVLAEIIGCGSGEALERLYELLEKVLKRDALHEQGVTDDELPVYAETVIKTQQRLLNNNYVELSQDDVLEIYKSAF